MTIVLSNVAAFALQVTILAAAGAALARIFRINEPRVALAYWRTLLLACLLLPICQPWTTTAVPATLTTAVSVTRDAPAPDGTLLPVTPPSMRWPIADFLLIGIAAGIAARVLWLTIGAEGLRRVRRDASPLEPVPESVRRAEERTGARAAMYVSDRISSPITFGVLRPIVVFPPSVGAMPPHVQEAIACHELLHVRRRDWVFEVVEEAVRCALWFHPAIWWLIERIQITREQVVDRAAIQLTDSRERYVESLLAVALAGSRMTLTPASPFLRRQFLKERVARILEETTMTTRRLLVSLSASAAVLALAATFAVRSFPLSAESRALLDKSEPIQIVRGGEHLLHGERPKYPHRAIEQRIEGEVVVEMTLNDRGEVSDARVVSGPEELRKATLEAVLHWHYSPAAISSTLSQATLRFNLPPAGLQTDDEPSEKVHRTSETPQQLERVLMEIEMALQDSKTTESERAELTAKQRETRMMLRKIAAERMEGYKVERKADAERHEIVRKVEGAMKQARTFEGSPRLVRIKTERISEETAKEILAQAGVAIGDSITEATAKRLREVARAMDEHLNVEFATDRNGELVMVIVAR